MSSEPLVDRIYTLEKMPGKGGWTYIIIPEITKDKRGKFGQIKVHGSIDSFQLKEYNLFPVKSGGMFLPVRAEIRKKIQKQEGDQVHVTLFADEVPTGFPEELTICFQEEPLLQTLFNRYSKQEQHAFVDWINRASGDHERIDRIAVTLRKTERGLKFHEDF